MKLMFFLIFFSPSKSFYLTLKAALFGIMIAFLPPSPISAD